MFYMILSSNKIKLLISSALILAGGFYLFSVINNNNLSDASLVGAVNNNQKNMIKIETIIEGSGAESKAGDVLTVHYTGTLENGTKFDSSVDRGSPFNFTLGIGQVIQGWEEGMKGMKVGEKRKLTIQPEYAYGSRGVPGVIPSNAVLIFEVELLGIN